LQDQSLWSADLREADLSYALLQRADLDHARLLWQANLRDANLSCAAYDEPNWTMPIYRARTCAMPILLEPRYGSTIVGILPWARCRPYRRAVEERASR